MLTKRTNILFDPDTWAMLTHLSRQKKATIGELVRHAIKVTYTKPSPKNDLLDVAGIIKNEAPDVSVNIAKYINQLYQEKTP